jgi:predicted ATPase
MGQKSVLNDNERWYVITGPPCCGKSTTIELLANRGFMVRPEVARAYIDEETLRGRKIQDIRSDMHGFQSEIMRRAIASELSLTKDEPVFLDRGVPDSLAYFLLYGISPEPYVSYIRSSQYRKVFYLDPPDAYATDYARIESAGERDRLARLLWTVYTDLGFCIERVPALPELDRIEYVLARAEIGCS